jgi:hypothetical protein
MKKKLILIAVCIAHSLVLLTFTYFEMKSPYTTGEELTILQLTSGLKRKVFVSEEKPDADRFLFISLSWDKKLIDKFDEYGAPIGKQPVTDRSKITQFLQVLNQKPDNHKFVTLDVFFADSSTNQASDDAMLAEELTRTRNLIIPYHLSDSSKIKLPIFQANMALADYEPTVEGLLVKFSIIHEKKYKTMPLVMYEQISGNKYSQGTFIDRLGQQPILSAFVLDHRIFEEDILEGNPPLYKKLYLNELLRFPPEVIHEFTKDKIIIMGDLDNRLDVHRTIYGDMLGPLILLNAFLALEKGDNQITWYFIAFLIAGYSLVSYLCFKQVEILEGWLLRWLPIPRYVREMLESFASYLLYFGLLAIVSYMLFDFHLTILKISIYMQLLEWIIKNIRQRYKKTTIIQTVH